MLDKPGSFCKGTMKQVLPSTTLVVILLFIVQIVPFVSSAGQGPEITSGSYLTFDEEGHIVGFRVWMEFPDPLDKDFSLSHIRLFVYDDEWSLDDPDIPYDHSWSNDNRTLTISSGDIDLSDRGLFSIKVSISLPLRTNDGTMLWEDSRRSEIELTFGNPDEFEPDYGPLEILTYFILPFCLMVVVLIVIEVVLRLTVKARDKDKVRSTTETLLKLIERTQRMLTIRLVITLVIMSVLMVAYISLMTLALVNFMFAMVMTWAAIFFLSPWVILVVTSLLYLVFRREDLAWRKRLEHLRKEQRKFLNDLDKE